MTPQHLDHIYDRLREGQRPDVIAHRTDDPTRKLSTPWFYELLTREVANGDEEWVTLLHRKFRRRRRSRKGDGSAHLIPNRVDIDQRPAEVNTRKTFGHWEDDTIIGAGHQGAVANAIVAMMRTMRDTVKTITFDNGGEFADHERLAQDLDCKTYFARPYRSCDRGTNEHVNGQLRKYDPKGKSLREVDPFYLQVNVEHLNSIPAQLDRSLNPRVRDIMTRSITHVRYS